jgi:hypothetical protein
MTEQDILLTFFILNWLLIIGDASLGYFVLPLLLRPDSEKSAGDGVAGDKMAVGGMRRLLTAMVLLYMLVNCYAFFRQYATLLYVVTALVLLDIIVQLVVRQRRVRQG